jgi:hypothetical protein
MFGTALLIGTICVLSDDRLTTQHEPEAGPLGAGSSEVRQEFTRGRWSVPGSNR